MKKRNRVRKSQEFQKIIHQGKKAADRHFVLYAVPKAEKQARAGVTLSKKIGNAVERNKIKRQVRMMCQDLIDFENASKDIILIVRFGYKDASFEENKNSLEKLLSKATIR